MSGVVEDVMGSRRIERVWRDTWGHLDAEVGVQHRGIITFAEGIYGGGQVILSCDLGDGAGSGPWFYEGVQDWLSRQDTEPGRLYRFEGYYLLTRRGKHKFVGTITTTSIESEA